MADEDLDLFYHEMADVTPLKPKKITDLGVLMESQGPTAGQLAKQQMLNEHELLSLLVIDPYLITARDPDEIVAHQHDGMQDAVFKQLRLGKYPIKTVLDVHEYSLVQARTSLINCILAAFDRGERNLLIIHGKGYKSKPIRALMKSAVCQWLLSIPQVAAFHSATRDQGGTGALFVMLKKSEQKKIENYEANRKGRGVR